MFQCLRNNEREEGACPQKAVLMLQDLALQAAVAITVTACGLGSCHESAESLQATCRYSQLIQSGGAWQMPHPACRMPVMEVPLHVLKAERSMTPQASHSALYADRSA